MAEGSGPSANLVGALAELAKDVGKVEAQVYERVTYKELMAQNTQQRGELTAKMDKMEDHLSENMKQSIDAVNLRLDSLMHRLESLSQQTVSITTTKAGGGKVTFGSVVGGIGAAGGVTGYLVMRQFGIVP
jgi:hypothetical protein